MHGWVTTFSCLLGKVGLVKVSSSGVSAWQSAPDACQTGIDPQLAPAEPHSKVNLLQGNLYFIVLLLMVAWSLVLLFRFDVV
eukprot:477805-Amphidinium_carterae.1